MAHRGVEPLGERASKVFRHVLDDGDARGVGWHGCQYVLQGLRAAGRGADGNHLVGGAGHRLAADLRLFRAGILALTHPGAGGGLDLVDQLDGHVADAIGGPGFADDVNGPGIQSLQRDLPALGGQ